MSAMLFPVIGDSIMGYIDLRIFIGGHLGFCHEIIPRILVHNLRIPCCCQSFLVLCSYRTRAYQYSIDRDNKAGTQQRIAGQCAGLASGPELSPAHL